MAIIRWLLNYWYVPLLFVIAVIGAIVLRRKPGVPVTTAIAERVSGEMRVIDAGAEVRRIQAEMGAEQARQYVLNKYEIVKLKLSAEQKEQATKLESDPIALAKFLVRVTP